MPAPIAITVGEPAGVGPDLTLALLGGKLTEPAAAAGAPAVVIGDGDLLAARAKKLGLSFAPPEYRSGDAPVSLWHCPLNKKCAAGRGDPGNAPSVIAQLERAGQGALAGKFAAVVTAPVDKGLLRRGGSDFSGHTEFFAALAGAPRAVMMLVGGGMRVALATTHLPLAQVPAALDAETLILTLRIIDRDLRRFFALPAPKIKVAALNPHGGEGGACGREEIEIIAPAIAAARQAGIDAEGPYPADTLFAPFARADADCILAMFHDQGLPPLKAADFFGSVNITLGLPFIRTSPDHGVAYDLAGRVENGKPLACARSFQAAFNAAVNIAARRASPPESAGLK